MKKYYLIALLLCVVNCISAQKLIDTWSGKITVGNGMQLTMVVHINGLATDSVTLDSPDQASYGLKVDTTSFAEASIYIGVKSLSVTIIGEFDEANDILKCTFTQRGNSSPLELKRGYKPKAHKQDPQDFPYIIEDLSIYNPDTDVRLAATLTAPYDYKFDKVVVLVSGSGQQNRNEEILGHKPFLVLSDYLTRNGIAVVRYDDRGFAESTGDYTKATTYDFAIDANSVVEFIKQDKRFADKQLGIVGHSEGGMIAEILATTNKNVDFIVMLAGPAVPITDLMLKQNYDVMKSYGNKEELLKPYLKITAQIYKVLTSNKLTEVEQREKVLALQKQQLELLPASSLNGQNIDTVAQINTETFFNPWMLYFLKFNPQEYLCKITIPVLALNGDKDLQVNSQQNLAGVTKGLKKAKNKNFRTEQLPGLNHLFQKCIFGSPAFYGRNEETFNEEAMKIVADWINALQK